MVPNPTAWWNVHLGPDKQTEECPAFLEKYCPPGSRDREIIATPDSQYRRLTWAEVQDCVARNRPDVFQRLPSHLYKYRCFCYELERQHGSIMSFMLNKRLEWPDPSATSNDFTADNYKIIFNDWPYGFDKRIIHLVVWTKFLMPEDASTGLLLPDMQHKVDTFVNSTFVKTCAPGSVVWFRNWASLKSVHAVEHIHILLFAPDRSLVDGWTNHDEPLAVKWGYIDRSEIFA